MRTPVLEISNVAKRFGGVTAVGGVSFHAGEAEVVGLIGPNGAGKTTLFNMIAQNHPADEGDIRFNGHSLLGKRPDEVATAGIVRTFQKLRPFPKLTVLENVMVGALMRTSSVQQARSIAREQLEFVELTAKAEDFADELSTGQRKRLEVARVLATKPSVVLLDEVTGGVDPRGVPLLARLMKRLRDELGLTVVVIEHRMKVILDVSDRIVALHLGQVIAHGEPRSVVADPEVVRSYLGGRHAEG